MNDDSEFDPMLDCYLSWEAAIEWMRQQHEAGVHIGKLWREAEERQKGDARRRRIEVSP